MENAECLVEKLFEEAIKNFNEPQRASVDFVRKTNPEEFGVLVSRDNKEDYSIIYFSDFLDWNSALDLQGKVRDYLVNGGYSLNNSCPRVLPHV